jgi:hypothetical protein
VKRGLCDLLELVLGSTVGDGSRAIESLDRTGRDVRILKTMVEEQ